MQLALDLAQHREDFRRIRFRGQDRLTFLHREGERTDIVIRLSQAAGAADRLGRFAELLIGDLEDLERLIIVLLRLSDDLKHLNRLENLAPLLFG